MKNPVLTYLLLGVACLVALVLLVFIVCAVTTNPGANPQGAVSPRHFFCNLDERGRHFDPSRLA